jgi:hypothetical protein
MKLNHTSGSKTPGTIVIFLYLVFAIIHSLEAQNKGNSSDETVKLANKLMQERKYDEALVAFNNSFTGGNNDLFDHYNAACCAALTGKKDEAFKLLKKTIALGYLDRKWAGEDADLASLRADRRWKSVEVQFDQQQKALEKKFTKIKDFDPTHLIPFKQNGMWGYVDKNSLKIIVAPEFRELGFMGDCTTILYKDRCRVRINNKGAIQEIHYPSREEDFDIALDDSYGPTPRAGIKGFRLDSNGNVLEYSEEFNRYPEALFNVSNPFLIDDKYYVIAHKKHRSGVIDQDGNALPGFDFIHNGLDKNFTAEHGIWFFAADSTGKSGFIDVKGNTRLWGELISHPLVRSDVPGLNLQHNMKSWGVLDFKRMEWVVRPQGIKLWEIASSYRGECALYSDKRELVDYYFLVHDKKDSYYVDTDLKAYKPLK